MSARILTYLEMTELNFAAQALLIRSRWFQLAALDTPFHCLVRSILENNQQILNFEDRSAGCTALKLPPNH